MEVFFQWQQNCEVAERFKFVLIIYKDHTLEFLTNFHISFALQWKQVSLLKEGKETNWAQTHADYTPSVH